MAFLLAGGALMCAAAVAAPRADQQQEVAQLRRTCKQVVSCEDAVQLWCNGYSRADGDGDGIPCENICHSKEEVDRIRAQIGC